MFKLSLLPETHLEKFEDETGRHYKTPAGIFDSVTTRIARYYGDDHLVSWRNRVGASAADRISKVAATNGTELHSVLEKFLLNETYDHFHSIAKMRFASVKRKIEPRISEVFGSELTLFSEKLKTAGKTDGIVRWDNEPVVMDLKTTKKYKKQEWVENYFVQGAAYGIMINEMYDLNIKKMIIVFSTDDFECYYFEKNIAEYEGLVNEIFK